MEFLVETAGVADRPALRRPAPECGGLGEAVVAAQALPPTGALQEPSMIGSGRMQQNSPPGSS